MPAENHALKNRLSQSSELNLTVIGRKSGRSITNPVWFVLEGDTLYLLPVHGSGTQWYKNALENPSIRIEAKDVNAAVHVVAITDSSQVLSVVKKFRDKYGAGDVKKYYSKLDVAVLAHMH
jgi:hypothetical protein